MTSIAHSPIHRRFAHCVRWFASIVLSALFLCIHMTVGAQPSWSVDWGKPYKADQPGDIFGFIHVDPTYSYAIRAKLPKLRGSSKEQKVALERYDNKLNFVKSSPLTMKYKGEPLSYEGFVFVANNPFVLCSYHNAKQDKNYLFARSFNMQAMKEEGEYLKILEMDLDNKFRGVEYKMTLSPDSSLLLISGAVSFLKESNKHYWLSVIDRKGKVVWSKNVKTPYSSFRVERTDYSLDNDGNVFALMERVRSNKEKRADGDKNFDISYHVFAHLDNGKTEKEYNCSLEGSNYMTDVKLVTTNEGAMQCAGYFYEKKSNVSEFWTSGNVYSKTSGVVSFKLKNGTGEPYDIYMQSFSQELLISDLNARKQSKATRKDDGKREVLVNYFLDYVHANNDGSILLVGEKRYVVEVSSGGKSSSYVPHHDDILVAKLDKNGRLEYACKVDKEQKGGVVYEYLFAPTTAERPIFLFKNGYKKSNPVNMAVVQPDGKVKYSAFSKEISSVSKATVWPQPDEAIFVWDGSGSKSRVGKVTFKSLSK